MRYWFLLLVLVLGCVGDDIEYGSVYVNAKVDFFDVEFPEVEGYEVIEMLRVETDEGLDPERSLVRTMSYFGEPSFTYSIQELRYVPGVEDLGDTGIKEIEGTTVHYWYWGEIPFVISGAYKVVWNDNNTLYAVSVKNHTTAFDVVEKVLQSKEVINFDDYSFLGEVNRLPDPYQPWGLYGVSGVKKAKYNLSQGYYITSDLKRVDLMVLHGDVDYVVGKMVDELNEPVGASIGGLVSYEGVVALNGEMFFRRIYKNKDLASVVTAPVEQREDNEIFINYLIEMQGAS